MRVNKFLENLALVLAGARHCDALVSCDLVMLIQFNSIQCGASAPSVLWFGSSSSLENRVIE